MKEGRRYDVLLRLFGVLVLGWCTLLGGRLIGVDGPIPAPVLLPAQVRTWTSLPDGTEEIAVALPSGEKLRGYWVPVPDVDDAPVMLHLIPSGSSVSWGGGVLQHLQALGIASLLLDYRGVGLSEGRRSSMQLAEDAVASYEEALRRAGGDESRVLIRAGSIGALATALVLEAGCSPRAISLIAPVRAETVVENFAYARLPAVFAFLALPFVHQPLEVDLLEQIRNTSSELIVACHREDNFLLEDERNLLSEAVRESGGQFVLEERAAGAEEVDGMTQHVLFCLGRTSGISLEELRLLQRLFPDLSLFSKLCEEVGKLPDNEARQFDDPVCWERLLWQALELGGRHLALAAFLAGRPEVREEAPLRTTFSWISRTLSHPWPRDVVERYFTMDGSIPHWRWLVREELFTRGARGMTVEYAVADLARTEDLVEFVGPLRGSYHVWAKAYRGILTHHGGDARRASEDYLRILLKARGFPDRVQTVDGQRRVEAWVDGEWVPVPR